MIDCLFPIETDDDTLSDDQAISKWIKLLIEASANLGRPLTDAKHHEQRLVDAGFINVHRKTFKWPTNSWPKDRHHKEVGLWTLANIGGGLEGLSMALLTRGCGWSKDEVLAFLTQVRKDLRDPRIHAYWPMYVGLRTVTCLFLLIQEQCRCVRAEVFGVEDMIALDGLQG